MASFRNVYTALLLVVAKATNKELARYVSFLKAENQILRTRLPERLTLTTREKNRLVRFGRSIGSALNHICTIVHPNTLRRWIRESNKTGLRDIFVLVFLNVKTRQVYITSSTYKPDQAWMIEQAEAFIKHTQDKKLPCKILMHDNDGKYSKPFLDVFKKAKIKPHRTAFRSPNTVAFVERFVQTIQQECLDHFVVFGHKHMDVLCREFKDHYHLERPHQGLDNELIARPPEKNGRSPIPRPRLSA